MQHEQNLLPPSDTAPLWQPLSLTGSALLGACEFAGEAIKLLAKTIANLRFLPVRLRETIDQMYYYGVSSIAVNSIFALFSGMILAFNTGIVLKELGMSQTIGTISAVAFCREWGPLMTAIILTARVGSSMTAEIGTMKISEEIDALEVMGIDPVQYLVLPRVVALALMTVALTMISDLIGITGSALVGHFQINVHYRTFYNEAVMFLKFKDVVCGLVKAFVFGTLIAIVSCAQGLRTTGGARGVGRSTMYAVVSSLIFIIIIDLIITKAFFM